MTNVNARRMALILAFAFIMSASTVFAQNELFDIKPGSCKNPVNLKSKGVIPMVIIGLGGSNEIDPLDVKTIAQDNITLSATAIVRGDEMIWAGDQPVGKFYKKAIIEDLASPRTPQTCGEDALDELDDLLIRYRTQNILKALAGIQGVTLKKGDKVTLTVSSNFVGSSEIFEYSDQITINQLPKLPKTKKK